MSEGGEKLGKLMSRLLMVIGLIFALLALAAFLYLYFNR
jgi:hypothetical protein